MQLSRKALEAYNAAVKAQGDNAEKAMGKALDVWFSEKPNATIAETRNFCITLLDEIARAYGNAAGDAAYALRGIIGDALGVELPDVDYEYAPAMEYIEEVPRYQVEKLKTGNVDGFKKEMRDAARYYAERGANDTMAALGREDAKKLGREVRFARVPMGATTCPYCLMLASRGFVYKSELNALNANHRNCDCRIVEGFAGMTIEGYDPDLYYDMWKHPEKYQQPNDEQRNIGPSAPISKTTSNTSIAECAAQTNPNYSKITDISNKINAKAKELNAMLPITSQNSADYIDGYNEYKALQKDYKRVRREWGQNCQRCVVAYELRRRGYDVTASKRLARNDTAASNWDKLFVNQQFTSVGSSDATIAQANLESEIGKYGDGSRSVVYVRWKTGSAHVFMVEQQNGKAVYIDPQSGTVDYNTWQQSFVPSSLAVSRVDDKQVNTKFLSKVVNVAK